MTSLRVLTCDDEPLALDRLDRMLERCDGVEIVASCGDAETALVRMIELRPDIAFIDIEMPKLDGFDVVEQLPGDGEAPLIVFVTAYSNLAAQAFETGALDFLPKPVRRTRLDMTLGRARAALTAREASGRLAELHKVLNELRAERTHVGEETAHIWIQRRSEIVRVDLSQVELIRAEGEYVRLFVGATTYLHRELIGSIEQRLDPRNFIRIHRSTIVRRDLVVAMKRSIHGGSIVRLLSGEEFSVGRKYAKATRAAFNCGRSVCTSPFLALEQ